VAGIEWDSDACATRYQAEKLTTQGTAKLFTVEDDVRNYGPANFPSATVLAGGPPCQTYTVAGSGAGRRALDEVLGFAKRMAAGENVTKELTKRHDVRTGLVLEPLRWALAAVRARRPYEAIVLEQVPAVLPVWEAVGEALAGRGYSVDCGVLRTEEFGVPQTRRRAILIARRNGGAMLPKPTHRPYRKGVPRNEGDLTLLPWVTMGETLDRPEPYEVVSNYGTGGDPKARGRRKSNQPAATVTGKISRNRVVASGSPDSRFKSAEAGRLQTFPADYPWAGRAVAQQIGNAIPPLLAAHVLAAALDLDDAVLTRAIVSLTGADASATLTSLTARRQRLAQQLILA
jgi:DNA (cytosine-5)-methyltransferase 1